MLSKEEMCKHKICEAQKICMCIDKMLNICNNLYWEHLYFVVKLLSILSEFLFQGENLRSFLFIFKNTNFKEENAE